jgi:hypothetical protein
MFRQPILPPPQYLAEPQSSNSQNIPSIKYRIKRPERDPDKLTKKRNNPTQSSVIKHEPMRARVCVCALRKRKRKTPSEPTPIATYPKRQLQEKQNKHQMLPRENHALRLNTSRKQRGIPKNPPETPGNAAGKTYILEKVTKF